MISEPFTFRKGSISYMAVSLIILFLLVGGMLASLVYYSIPAIAKLGYTIYTSSRWDPSRDAYGALAAIYGSLVVSSIAIVIAIPLALGSSIFVVEYANKKARQVLGLLNDLMASFPTIIYGFWGLYILGPFLKVNLFEKLHAMLGFLPLFSTEPFGPSLLLASIVLAIMIIPFAASTIREVYSQIPSSIDEGAYSLGLRRLDLVKIKLSYIKPAIAGGIALAYGRGVGETVAVALTVGGALNTSPSLLAPGYTIPALIADQFGSAYSPIERGALFSLSLLIFVIGLTFVTLAKLILGRSWKG